MFYACSDSYRDVRCVGVVTYAKRVVNLDPPLDRYTMSRDDKRLRKYTKPHPYIFWCFNSQKFTLAFIYTHRKHHPKQTHYYYICCDDLYGGRLGPFLLQTLQDLKNVTKM